MQTQKDEIKYRILDSARIEFQEKGFEKASIRNIARAADVSKSNIYNYFKSKELLFEAVVEDTIMEIEIGLEKLKENYNINGCDPYSISKQNQMMVKFMKFVFSHKHDLKLLLFKSYGTKFFNFKEKITEKLYEIFKIWLKLELSKKDIPRFFILSIAGFYIDTIEKIIANDLTKEEVLESSDCFLKFIYGGWEKVFEDNRINK